MRPSPPSRPAALPARAAVAVAAALGPCPPDYISYCQDKCIYNGDREGGFYTREKRELSPTLRYYDKVQFQNFTPINPE